MKKFNPRFLAAILAALVLAACGGTPIADKVIKEVVDPPSLPAMGDSIPLAVGQPVEITDGSATLTLEYQGKNETGQSQWTCVDEKGESCAERHGNEPEMVFYFDFKKVGETVEGSFKLAEGWEEKLYP